MRQHIAILIVLSMIFLFIAGCSQKVNPKIQPKVEKRAEAIQPGTVKVVSKDMKSTSELFDINIRVPQLQGLKDRNVEKRINDNIMEDAQEIKEDLEEDARDDFEEYRNKGGKFRPYSIKGDYEVKYNKENVLSLYMTYLEYTGGAHPITEPESLNLNIRTGKKLKLKDFFKPNQDYKKIIEREIMTQINQNKEKFYDDALKKIKNEIDENDLDFYVEDGKLVIYFEEYEIAPHSSGIPKFKIPIQKIPK